MASNPWLKIEVDGEGISTIVVDEGHLDNFPRFMHHVIKEKIGMDLGVFKIRWNEVVPQTSLEQLTSYVKKYFSTKFLEKRDETSKGKWKYPEVDAQEFFYGHHQEHLYGYLKANDKKTVKSKLRNFFLKCISDPQIFQSASQCCSVELSKSLQDLERHHWSTIRNISHKSSEMILDDTDVPKILHEAEPLRKKYCFGKEHCLDILKREEMTEENFSSVNERKRILYASGIIVKNSKFPITSKFSLSDLGSILDEYKEEVAGISSPFLYVGSPHASFACHIEDAALFSANYLHYGAPCVWFFVPPEHYKLFSDWAKYFSLDISQVSCSNVVGSAHKFILASKEFLHKLGIRCHVVLQKPQEMVITFPFAIHSGFKTGWNVQEAANFGDEWWIEPAILAPSCECFPFLMKMDLTKLIAICAPHLLQMYIDRDIVGIMKSLSSNEFIQLLGLIPKCVMSESNVSVRAPVYLAESTEPIEFSLQVGEASDEGEHNFFYKGSRCVLRCPSQECQQCYEGGRSKINRLLNHIDKCHSGSPDLVAVLIASYPPKPKKAKKLMCHLCGEWKLGGETAMKLHVSRKHSPNEEFQYKDMSLYQ